MDFNCHIPDLVQVLPSEENGGTNKNIQIKKHFIKSNMSIKIFFL